MKKKNNKVFEINKRFYQLSLYSKYISLSLCKKVDLGVYKPVGKIFIIVRFDDEKFGQIIFDEILNDTAKVKYLIKSNQIYNQKL